MMTVKIVTYHSLNADPDKAWIAHVVFPNGEYWGVRFSGESEEAVIVKAKNMWAQQRNKQLANPVTPIQKPVENTHHLAGKVWLRQKDTNKLIRVAKEDVDKYLANGYYRSGPNHKGVANG